MGDPMRDAWNEVADGFAKLGDAMKDRYRGEADGAPADGAAGAPSGYEGLREAFERLIDAGREVGQRSIDVLRDPDVNSQAKDAASSLNDALSATVDLIGNEVGRWFGRGATATQDATPEPHDIDAADPATTAAMIDQQIEDAEAGVGPTSVADRPTDDLRRPAELLVRALRTGAGAIARPAGSTRSPGITWHGQRGVADASSRRRDERLVRPVRPLLVLGGATIGSEAQDPHVLVLLDDGRLVDDVDPRHRDVALDGDHDRLHREGPPGVASPQLTGWRRGRRPPVRTVRLDSSHRRRTGRRRRRRLPPATLARTRRSNEPPRSSSPAPV